MRRKNKIIAGGALAGILAITLVIALFPVMLYGFSVQTFSISCTPSVDAMASSSTSDDSRLAYGFSLGGSLNAEYTVYNPYAYFGLKLQGNAHGSGSIDLSTIPGSQQLQIILLFQLTITNPLGQTKEFNFNLNQLVGIIDANLVVGNDMMQIVNGTYDLELFITLTIIYNGAQLYYENESISGSVDIVIY